MLVSGSKSGVQRVNIYICSCLHIIYIYFLLVRVRVRVTGCVTGVTAASSGTSDSRISRVSHTHTLVQKSGVSPVRRQWRAQQRDVSIPEGGRGDTGRGLRDGLTGIPDENTLYLLFPGLILGLLFLIFFLVQKQAFNKLFIYMYIYIYIYIYIFIYIYIYISGKTPTATPPYSPDLLCFFVVFLVSVSGSETGVQRVALPTDGHDAHF